MSKFKFSFNIEKKHFALAISFILFLGGILLISAYNPNFNNPVTSVSNIGHTASEIDVKLTGGSIVSLQSLFVSSTESGEIPVGAILMFDTNCPSGWTRFAELDGKVPKGFPSYGGIGGAETHSHAFTASRPYADIDDNHAGNPISGINALPSASSWPPYLNVVWCKKN